MTPPRSTQPRTLEIHTSPHIASGSSVEVIMRNVVWALLPTSAFAVYAFGLAGLLLLLTAVGTCVVTEHLFSRSSGSASTIGDWSVVITGLLFGLTLPPGLPLWMVVVGGVFGVAVGKYLFGGLGANAFNIALVGRAFLQAAFPVALTSWSPAFLAGRFTELPSSTLTLPLTQPIYDAISGATPLSAWKFDRAATETRELAMGFIDGSAGETSAVLIVLGGLYLIARNMMNWRIPASVLGTVALLSGIFHLVDPSRYPSVPFMLFSGGLMLGAMFMATDMVASPMTPLGLYIYGGLIGTLVVVIRLWGGMPEGVMYAILLANAVSPHIDRIIQPRVYGTQSPRMPGGAS